MPKPFDSTKLIGATSRPILANPKAKPAMVAAATRDLQRPGSRRRPGGPRSSAAGRPAVSPGVGTGDGPGPDAASAAPGRRRRAAPRRPAAAGPATTPAHGRAPPRPCPPRSPPPSGERRSLALLATAVAPPAAACRRRLPRRRSRRGRGIPLDVMSSKTSRLRRPRRSAGRSLRAQTGPSVVPPLRMAARRSCGKHVEGKPGSDREIAWKSSRSWRRRSSGKSSRG